jgi:uncharacterized protein
MVEGGVVAARTSRAVELYRIGCDGGVAPACTGLGTMYGNGYGVARNAAQAFDALRRACDAGDPDGCGGLGFMYESGTGTAADLGKALDLLVGHAMRGVESVAPI